MYQAGHRFYPQKIRFLQTPFRITHVCWLQFQQCRAGFRCRFRHLGLCICNVGISLSEGTWSSCPHIFRTNWAPVLKMLKAVAIVWGFLSFIYQSWLHTLFSEILSLLLRWVSSQYVFWSPTWGSGTLITYSLVEVLTNSKKVKRNFCSCGWVFSLSCVKYFFSLWKHVIFEGASPSCGYLFR